MKRIIEKIEDYLNDKGFDSQNVFYGSIALIVVICFSTVIFLSVRDHVPGWIDKDLSELKVYDVIILLFVWKVLK